MGQRMCRRKLERMPDRMLDSMSDRMSEYMSDRMSERMPDRMSERMYRFYFLCWKLLLSVRYVVEWPGQWHVYFAGGNV